MKHSPISILSLGPKAQKQVADAFLVSAPKRAKYRNERTSYKSIQGFEHLYDSRKEAAYARDLDLLIRSKDVLWWLPQVSIPLPGGVTYRADFLVQRTRCIEFVDVKGKDTQASINKRKQVKSLFGIVVRIV